MIRYLEFISDSSHKSIIAFLNIQWIDIAKSLCIRIHPYPFVICSLPMSLNSFSTLELRCHHTFSQMYH